VYYCILSVGFELTSIPVIDTEQPFHRIDRTGSENTEDNPYINFRSQGGGRSYQCLRDVAVVPGDSHATVGWDGSSA
jgi:hypothetical protein